MAIDTHVAGDAGSIKAAGSWLEDSLAEGVFDRTSDAHRARNEAGSGWWGDAGDVFHTRLEQHTRTGDDLAKAAKDIGGAFHRYAGELAKAQERMGQARATATAGGLTVTADAIAAPGPPPAPITAPAADGPVNPQEAARLADAVKAHQDHARKTVAYLTAAKQAGEARNLEKAAKNFLDGIYHRYLTGGEGSVLNGLGDLNALRSWISDPLKNALSNKADQYRAEAGKAFKEYLEGAPEAGLAKVDDLLAESKRAASNSDFWDLLSKDVDFRGLATGTGGALAGLQTVVAAANGASFGKAVMAGVTSLGIDALPALLGVEGGPAGIVAVAAAETYLHPDGAGEVAKVLHDLPHEVEDKLLDKAGDFLTSHGHKHLGAAVDTVSDLDRMFSRTQGDAIQGAVTMGGDAANHVVDHTADALDTGKKTFVDLASNDYSGLFHDTVDGMTTQAGDFVDDAKDLGGDLKDTGGHAVHDLSSGAKSVVHHLGGLFP